MKTDLNFLALDCEFNQPSGKLIEVGVCIGNLDKGVFFQKNWLMDPCEPLSAEIIELTGISDELIADQATAVDVLRDELVALDKEFAPFVNPVVWGIGDESRVKDFVRQAGLDFPIWGHRTIDVKTIYVFNQLIKAKSAKAGLKSALSTYKLNFEGRPHRAMDDARNTLRLFLHLVNLELKRNQAISSLTQLI